MDDPWALQGPILFRSTHFNWVKENQEHISPTTLEILNNNALLLLGALGSLKNIEVRTHPGYTFTISTEAVRAPNSKWRLRVLTQPERNMKAVTVPIWLVV